MFITNPDTLISSHIINYQRVAPQKNNTFKLDDLLRKESSDHLPILGVFSL